MKTDSTNENCCVDQQDYRAPEIMTLRQRLHVDRLNRKGTLEIYYVSDGVFLLRRYGAAVPAGNREVLQRTVGHQDVQQDNERCAKIQRTPTSKTPGGTGRQVRLAGHRSNAAGHR
jgi:hypothetical protein